MIAYIMCFVFNDGYIDNPSLMYLPNVVCKGILVPKYNLR